MFFSFFSNIKNSFTNLRNKIKQKKSNNEIIKKKVIFYFKLLLVIILISAPFALFQYMEYYLDPCLFINNTISRDEKVAFIRKWLQSSKYIKSLDTTAKQEVCSLVEETLDELSKESSSKIRGLKYYFNDEKYILSRLQTIIEKRQKNGQEAPSLRTQALVVQTINKLIQYTKNNPDCFISKYIYYSVKRLLKKIYK